MRSRIESGRMDENFMSVIEKNDLNLNKNTYVPEKNYEKKSGINNSIIYRSWMQYAR